MSSCLKCLIVDDEYLIRRALEEACKQQGHIVKTAADGMEALKILQNQVFDLVFLDLLIPKLAGLELLKKITKPKDTRIILMSAHDEFDKIKLEKTQASLFVKKPFSNIFQLIKQAEELTK